MSYIIAFVSYADFNDKQYPVQCFRTDLKANDLVVIRRADGKLRNAKIIRLEYLNWDCNSSILCKKSECTIDINGTLYPPTNSPIIVGLSTSEVFIQELKKLGWIPLISHSATYRCVFAQTNNTQIAYFFIRKNGIDLQLLPVKDVSLPLKSNSLYTASLSHGKVVRHTLSHTTFNLFEGLIRFTTSFMNNEKNLNRYFVPQGEKDKRTEHLKQQRKQTESSLSDIYSACNDGNGGPVYLSDGVWITSNGGLHDWGR